MMKFLVQRPLCWASPRRISFFFPKPQPPKQVLRPNFPKPVTSGGVFAIYPNKTSVEELVEVEEGGC